MSPGRINRCICHNRMFAEIKRYSREHNITSVHELQEIGFCSTNCGLCIPYIKAMLETAETEFIPGNANQTTADAAE
ncbi:hypothetical protein SAMN05443144_11160 [Fodinibius roseus]|uniref:BFD-like [2Fe-2S] binding domain-containing protein n=1 Tax=Fodinibius roseus TaxID=1194090 RepID=A0A1M5DBN0_9BACT|nr:hypothetical protein SAMN05443144_11160 [Fodinibius roseus]